MERPFLPTPCGSQTGQISGLRTGTVTLGWLDAGVRELHLAIICLRINHRNMTRVHNLVPQSSVHAHLT